MSLLYNFDSLLKRQSIFMLIFWPPSERWRSDHLKYVSYEHIFLWLKLPILWAVWYEAHLSPGKKPFFLSGVCSKMRAVEWSQSRTLCQLLRAMVCESCLQENTECHLLNARVSQQPWLGKEGRHSHVNKTFNIQRNHQPTRGFTAFPFVPVSFFDVKWNKHGGSKIVLLGVL